MADLQHRRGYAPLPEVCPTQGTLVPPIMRLGRLLYCTRRGWPRPLVSALKMRFSHFLLLPTQHRTQIAASFLHVQLYGTRNGFARGALRRWRYRTAIPMRAINSRSQPEAQASIIRTQGHDNRCLGRSDCLSGCQAEEDCRGRQCCRAGYAIRAGQQDSQEILLKIPTSGAYHMLKGVVANFPTCMRHAPLAQVDGTFEDWVEVLRLIYHGGGWFPILGRGAFTVPTQCAHTWCLASTSGGLGLEWSLN